MSVHYHGTPSPRWNGGAGSLGPLSTTPSRYQLPDHSEMLHRAVIPFEEGLGDRVAWAMAVDRSPPSVIESAWRWAIKPARDRAKFIARQKARQTRLSAPTLPLG